MKKLTIITINYNHVDGLKRTIDSIVNQTFTNYEWIVVDGGSTDGSKELIEQFQDHFAWWCSEPDKGVYNAMNKGIAHATGEYVNFMNSGDIFATPTILEEIFSIPHTANVLYGIMTRGTIDGKWNNKPLLKSHINWWDFYYCTFNHQATFTQRDLFMKFGGFDESYHILADWRHFAQLICVEHCSYEYISKIIAIYEGGGISDEVSDQNIKEQRRIRKEVYPTLLDEHIPELRYMDICKRFWFSQKLLYLLTHSTNWIYKHIKS